MVTRSKKGTTGQKRQTKGRVKVRKLNINKETVKDLSASEQKQVKGAARRTVICHFEPPVGTVW